MYKLSVIIPFYNDEKVILDSIQSLVEQTIFDQILFIFVNDGSTDNSVSIVQEYIEKYTNMRLLSQEHSGASKARNLGLDEIDTEYVAFFDADDIANPILYERLLELIENEAADMSVVDYSKEFSNGSVVKHRRRYHRKLEEKKDIIIEYLKGSEININVFDKVFRRNIINTVRFPEGLTIGEDMYFVYSALQNVKNGVVIDSSEPLYLYRIRDNSVMRSSFSEKNNDAVELARRIMKEADVSLFEYARANYIHEICKALRIMYNSGVQENYAELRELYWKEIRQYSIWSARKYMNSKHFLAFILMRLSPDLYNIIYKAMKIG